MPNTTLHAARRNQRDEFYTQLTDIENELRHYRPHFAGKTVYCNCDDPYESNFFKYFAANFDFLKLKRLIATGYKGSPAAGTQLSLDDMAGLEAAAGGRPESNLVIDIREVGDRNKDGAVNIADVEWLLRNDANTVRPLAGDGDFRSPECVALLQEADIVVTNPPFSLFREYIAQLVAHGKDFLILGNMNAVTYKETFELITAGSLWLGVENNRDKKFLVPDSYDQKTAYYDEKLQSKVATVGAVWFTNLDHSRRHLPLPLYARYSPEAYPHYDNYDAINVNKVADIPEDYDGVMGVPITFLDKWCPEQFEIVDANTVRSNDSVPVKAHGLIKDKDSAVNGKPTYVRVAIRHRKAV